MLKIKPLSNIQIDNLINKWKIKNYGGCIMSDEINKIKDKHYYIINLEDSHKKGSHWVALYYDKNNISYYYDSYGFIYDEPLNKLLKNVIYNEKQHQYKNSYTCGYYCLLFILFMSKNNNNFNEFLNLFDNKNYIKNEKFIMNIFNLS
jgi:hypothetical protein